MQTELGARCTGFLVAPQVVMTAAHCLFLPKVGHFIQPGSVHVLLGYESGRYRAHARVTGFTIAQGYRPQDEAATAGLDRAVLVLDRRLAPVGAVLSTGMLPVRPAGMPPLPAWPVAARLAGYGQDREEVAVADPACRLTGMSADGQGHPLLSHDCDATGGTSGAPLLIQRADGRWIAIGIQIAARAGSAGGLAVPLGAPASNPTDSSVGR